MTIVISVITRQHIYSEHGVGGKVQVLEASGSFIRRHIRRDNRRNFGGHCINRCIPWAESGWMGVCR